MHKYTYHTFVEDHEPLRVGDNIYTDAMANTGRRRNTWWNPMSKQHVSRTRIRHGNTHGANNTEQHV